MRAKLALSLVVLAVNSGYAESDHAREDIEEIVVTGDLDSLPGEDIRSVFGFGKSLLETPRSVSTVSDEIGGWNRLTQDLIDHGSYVTGSPAPLDADGDGYISHQEFDVDGDGFTDLNPFAAGLVPGTSAGLDDANRRRLHGVLHRAIRGPGLGRAGRHRLGSVRHSGRSALRPDRPTEPPAGGKLLLPSARHFCVVLERSSWRLAANAKNVTDQRYFRANFPNLFGSVVVLPELPRHYALSIEYRW